MIHMLNLLIIVILNLVCCQSHDIQTFAGSTYLWTPIYVAELINTSIYIYIILVVLNKVNYKEKNQLFLFVFQAKGSCFFLMAYQPS